MSLGAYGTIVATAVVGLAAISAGCGGSDESTEERIRNERQEAAAQARQEEKLRQLEKEVARARRQGNRGSGRQPSAPSGGQPAPATGTSCGGGLFVGPNTTCSFAENVREAYRESGGSSRIAVYSPVTQQTYMMSCTGGSTTVCTGGNNASVSFR